MLWLCAKDLMRFICYTTSWHYFQFFMFVAFRQMWTTPFPIHFLLIEKKNPTNWKSNILSSNHPCCFAGLFSWIRIRCMPVFILHFAKLKTLRICRWKMWSMSVRTRLYRFVCVYELVHTCSGYGYTHLLYSCWRRFEIFSVVLFDSQMWWYTHTLAHAFFCICVHAHQKCLPC